MQEIAFSPQAYCKMIMHTAKYPHCAVNGVFLAAENRSNEKNSSVELVDAVPMFHLCLHVSPMAEIALSQIESWAESRGLILAGYYLANANLNDTSFDKPAHRIAEKIFEKLQSSSLVVVDNKLVSLSHTEPAIKTFYNTDGRWRLLDKTKVQIDASVLETTSTLLQQKAHHSLVDIDNHLDNISLDWRNTASSDRIDELSS